MSQHVKLSTLWIFVMFNMAFADILGFIYPGTLNELATGVVDGITITPMFVLVAAVLVEIGIAMILVSRFAALPLARRANLIAAPITILFIVGGGSLTPHYIFFASLEVIALLYIFQQAWKWRLAA